MKIKSKKIGAICASLLIAGGSLFVPLGSQIALSVEENTSETPALVKELNEDPTVNASTDDMPGVSLESTKDAAEEIPEEDSLQFDRISLEIGETEDSRNFNWLSNSEGPLLVQVASKPANWSSEQEFPTTGILEGAAKASPSERDGLNSFKASISGLSPNTSYVYRVGNNNGWSEVYEFETGDLGDNQPFSFMFAGDPQIGASGNVEDDTNGWINTLNTMEQAFPDTDFMISLGDQINTGDQTSVENEYEGFFAPEVLHGITLATNVGNHETYAKNGHYSHNYNMPNVSGLGATKNEGRGSGDFWFTYNGVLFMSLNSNNLNTVEHKAFMEQAIAKNPEANWKVVSFHHSIYSTASHTADNDILQRRSALSPIFSELDIDVVLMGHDHVYTRSYLMEGTRPVITDSVESEIVNPDDGQVLYLTANSASGSKFYNLKNLPENTFAAVKDQSKRENMTHVEVTEDSMTFTTYYTDDAVVDPSSDVVDKVSLTHEEENLEDPHHGQDNNESGSNTPENPDSTDNNPSSTQTQNGSENNANQAQNREDAIQKQLISGNKGSGSTKKRTSSKARLPQTGDISGIPVSAAVLASFGFGSIALHKSMRQNSKKK